MTGRRDTSARRRTRAAFHKSFSPDLLVAAVLTWQICNFEEHGKCSRHGTLYNVLTSCFSFRIRTTPGRTNSLVSSGSISLTRNIGQNPPLTDETLFNKIKYHPALLIFLRIVFSSHYFPWFLIPRILLLDWKKRELVRVDKFTPERKNT